MAYEGGRGPKKSGGFGGKPRGAGPSRGPGGPRKSYGQAGEGRPAYGEKRSYGPRKEFGERGGDKPAFGERKPYGPRKDFGDRPARPYTPRGEGSGDRSRGYGPRKEYGERGGDRPARPYTPRGEGEERLRSYGPRKEYGDRGDRPARPYAPRAPREETFERPAKTWGDAKKPRYAEKVSGKAQFERKPKSDDSTVLANRDGWLVGQHAVLAALRNGRRKIREVWLLSEATGELAQVLGAHPEWPVQIKAREDFNREFADAVHQGVAALVGNLHQPSLPELLASKPRLLVALDQVTDPHNLGAIVRSAAAFGAGGVLVTEHRAAGVNATAAKAAAGALETVPVAEITNLANGLKMLQENGYYCIGLAGEAEAELAEVLTSVKAKQPVCLVVGSEGEGLRRLTREHCDQLAKIAIADAVESLNVSVATGVALALISRR
ncbi:MAG: 23S rRNA (guanosine(2251)-2'-O)-methyltransferase RlmB [Alphaproteobacteria bacterium]|nr:23S rRNA (guanosine(2251)-2'-O)-methyltransferase RlmB [Alphaproteobacteria bacterium]